MRYADLLGSRSIFSTRPPDAPPPLVTVVMPTFRRHSEGMLVRCIDSVLRQSLPDFEFIVMDDGSTDGTAGVLHEAALRDPRLVHVRLERNSGLPGVLINEAVRMGRGQFIAYMFDDNEWFPQALEYMINTARTSEADLVHGKAYVVQADGRRVEYGKVPTGYESLGCFNTIPNGAVLTTRAFVDTYGLYDPHYVIGRLYDWELWLRAWNMGARFTFVDEFITTEYGPTSSTSLGNAVRLNYPISAAYLQDEFRRVANAARLTPETIDDYDILDPEAVLPYVRSMGEWEIFEDAVYKPLLKRHPEYVYRPPLRHNRRFDHTYQPYQLNPVFGIFNDRKRSLILSNRVTPLAKDLRDALQADGRRVVLIAPQWSGDLYNVDDLDEIILVDTVINWVLDETLNQVDLHKPIIVIHQSDVAEPAADVYAPLQNAWQTAMEIKQSLVAFPGIRIDPGYSMYRDQLRGLADLTISSQPEGSDLPLPCLPNRLLPAEVISTALERNLYVGDFSALSKSTRLKVRELGKLGWRLWLFPWSRLPETWETIAGVRWTNDSLPTCALTNPDAAWSAVPEVAQLHQGFDQICLQEGLLKGGGLWLEFETAGQNPDLPDVDELRRGLIAEHTCQSAGLCADARWRQWRNLLDGAAFQHRVARQRGKRSARETSGQVFINSQAIGGSEAVGMQAAWVFNRLGIRCRLSVPASVNVHPGGFEMINRWLVDHGLSAASAVEYGLVNYALYRQQLDDADLTNLVKPLQDWLANENPDWLYASAIIPEPAVTAGDRLCLMSMFSPWDYPLHRLTFLRDFVDGGFSDTSWAARHWSAWLQPPFGVVRSLVEPNFFRYFNLELPDEPIQVAVIGALQPRKRQREAILAARSLLQKGYRVNFNFYGYEFAGFTDYIDGLKDLAAQPDLAGRVHIHGFVEEMDQILAGNHILFSASGDESLPNSLLQAMAASLIPVAAPAGGIPEAIEDGVTGFLAHGFEVDALAEALERAIAGRPNWPQIANHARDWVAENCSEQAFAASLLAVMLPAADIWAAPGSLYYTGPAMLPASSAQEIQPPEYTRLFLSLADENRLRPGPELNTAPLVFNLHTEQDGWCGIRVRFGTYFRQPAGQLQIEIHRPGTRRPIRHMQVNLARVQDNEWLELMFEPIRRSLGQNFEVQISAEVASGRLAIYEMLPKPQSVHLAVLRVGQASRRYLKARLPLHRSGLAVLPIYHREAADE